MTGIMLRYAHRVDNVSPDAFSTLEPRIMAFPATKQSYMKQTSNISQSFLRNFFVESGKVVIVLAGRHAGKKAVVVKTFDDGNSDKRFSHCLIAGLARGPRKVTKSMNKAQVEKRCKAMKPFVKYMNVRHVFPTRYVVDLDLKKAVDEAELVDAERKVDVKKNLKKLFLDRYLNQKEVTSEKKAQGSTYFFQKLRF